VRGFSDAKGGEVSGAPTPSIGDRNAAALRRPRSRTLKALNQLYFVTILTVEALNTSREVVRNADREKLTLEVPRIGGGTLKIEKRRTKVAKALKLEASRDAYAKALIVGVAHTEDYLTSTLRQVLTWVPEKLLLNSEGLKVDKSVKLEEVIKSKSRASFIAGAIEKRILELSYGSPSDFFDYTKDVLGIQLDKSLAASFFELKATRDLLVHAGGIINQKYLDKAGSAARGQIGHEIEIDVDYFESAIRTLKAVTSSIYSQCVPLYREKGDGSMLARPSTRK